MRLVDIALLPELMAAHVPVEVDEATMPRARSAVMRVARRLGGAA